MKRIAVCVLLAAGGLANQAQDSLKPVCNKATRGQFWPDAANSDPVGARQLSQCGALEVCAYGRWRYKWQSVTVNVRQLGKTPQPPTPACVAVIARFGEHRGQP